MGGRYVSSESVSSIVEAFCGVLGVLEVLVVELGCCDMVNFVLS